MTLTEPIPRRALAVTFALAALAAAAATLVRSDDPDLFHHLALGREIVRAGLFTDERLVFSTWGRPIGVAPYWLGSVVLYLWHALSGDSAVSLLPAMLGGITCVILLAAATPRAGRHSALTLAAAALPVSLALEVFRYRAVPRPEVFGAVLLAWTLWAIRRFEDGRRAPLLFFPAVAVLWTNLHPSTAVGLVPLTLLVLATAADAARARWRGVPGSWAPAAIALAILTAGLAATALRPGFTSTVGGAVRFALATFGLGVGSAGADPALRTVASTVLEVQGGGAALWISPVGALLVPCAVAFVANGRSVWIREVVTIAAFAVLPFAAVRFALFFAIVAAPIAARNIASALARLPAAAGRVPARTLAAGACVAAAVASLPLGAQAPHIRFGAGIAYDEFPIRAADYLEGARFEGRLFDTFHLGGYLEWRRVGPPYQDGRGSAPPEDAPGSMVGPLDRAAFAPLDARYRFDALLLAYPTIDPAFASMVGPSAYSPDARVWALVAFDDGGLLYLRRDGRYADLAARDEFRAATPANPYLLADAAALPAVLPELRRSVVEAPGCVRCRYLAAEAALACGLPQEAASTAAAGLPLAHGPARAALESVAARAALALRGSSDHGTPGGR